MTTGQQVTLGLAGSLALVSLWKQQSLQGLWKLTTNQGPVTDPGAIFKPIGLDLAFVLILTWVAGLTPDAGKPTGILLVGLWLLFLMHPGQAASTGDRLRLPF